MTQKTLKHSAPNPAQADASPTAARWAGPRHEQLSAHAARLNDAPAVQRLARHDAVQRKANGLPEPLKAGVEALSGLSLNHVEVHYNSPRPAQLQAHAFAQGSHIHIAPGQERHLPHEAWHVVQQAQGRVQPSTQLRQAVAINDDAGLEHEADVMGARALGLHLDTPVATQLMPASSGRVVQLAGDEDDKKPAPFKKAWLVHPSGAVLQSMGFLLLSSLARKPQYAKLSFSMFTRQMPMDFLKLKLGLGSVLVGNHLMGTEDMLGAATRGTRMDVRPKLTAQQDIINWVFGLGHGIVGGVIGHRALSLGHGLGKVPLGNMGALMHVLLVYQLLSAGTKLMGKEGKGAELIRSARGQGRHSDGFPHSAAKEHANDLISQILYAGSLYRLHQIARMTTVPGYAPFARMRMKALAGAGLFAALNLSPAASLFPLLLGQSPSEVSFDPRHNPLDLSRTVVGATSSVVGLSMLDASIRQMWLSMKQADRLKFMMNLRGAGFGGVALFGGMTLMQLLPVLYKMTHPEAVQKSGKDDEA